MADDSTLPSPGDVLAGKYQIERLIGRGGMGAVFAAQHMLLNQRVAVKLLLGELASSKEATNRFMNEARAAAQIQGEHVARVLDIGQLPTGTPYMVLEYLDGTDLAGLLHQRGVLGVAEVADYAIQALEALAQAHAAGIVHRDLKPANLFLARRHDGGSVVKVLDFGISKNLNPLSGTPQGLTQTRALLGSPEYMSPEQLRTPRGVDARTDIWSMGVILYELLTGKMPFTGESLGELFMQIMESTPPPVRALRPDVPAALEAAVMRCMIRDPNARFATVKELSDVLVLFASDPMRALLAARGSAPGLLSVRPTIQATQHMTVSASTAPPNTSAPWSSTGQGAGVPAGVTNAQRGRVVAIIGTSVLCAVIAFVGVLALANRAKGRDDIPAASQGLTIDSTATAPSAAPMLPALSAASAALGDAGSAAAIKAPSPAAPAVVPPSPNIQAAQAAAAGQAGQAAANAHAQAPAVKPTPTATVALPSFFPPPAAPTAAAPAAAAPAAKNCSPNYYFDKDGHKHFKPECF